jgi:hypothetical protein
LRTAAFGTGQGTLMSNNQESVTAFSWFCINVLCLVDK